MKHKTYKKFYIWCQRHGIGKILDQIPDKTYLEILYFLQCGKCFDIDNPQTYNEKMQWLKIHGGYEKFSDLVDKVEAKKIATSIIGEKYIIPTYAVYEKVNQIDISALPKQFVLKCTHDSGSNIVCLDKENFNFERKKKKLEQAMKIDYSGYLREKQYRGITPRIIAEKFIGVDDKLPMDYKFFCFDGVPKIVMVAIDRDSAVKTNFYNMNFERLPLMIENPNFEDSFEIPSQFEEMKHLVGKLSQGYKHIRIDLYNVSSHIYFSEFTFQHWGGFSHIEPSIWDEIMGDWIH